MFKEKVRYKSIVGDPYATEAKWLPACASIADSSVIDNIEGKKRISKSGTFCILLACCYLAAFGFANGVSIGYDWGYHVIDKIVGQTHQDNQGIIANVSLAFAVLPLIFGIFFGGTLAREKTWRSWLPLGVALAFGSSAIACIGVEAWDFFVRTLVDKEFWFYEASMLVFGSVGLLIGKNLFAAVDKRIRGKPIVAAVCLQIAIFGSLLVFREHGIKPLLELGIYATSLFSSAVLCSLLSKPRDKFNAIALPTLASFPIVAANILNVAMNVISLSLDQINCGLGLGVQALLSSILISILAGASIAAGGLTGYKFAKRSV